MECFDHGKETTAMCGWCGKNLCPACVGRQDGRKKYCRACATKMGDFSPGAARAEQEAIKTTMAEPVHHEEEPRITPIAQTKRPVVAAPSRHIDPRHFELDDDVPHVRPIKQAAPAHPATPSPTRAMPTHSATPIHTAAPTHTAPAHPSAPAPGNAAARNAFSMFASSAKTTAAGHTPTHSAPMGHPAPSTPLHSASHASPSMGSSPQPAAPAHNGSPIGAKPANSGSGAASKALGFFATSAKEMLDKNKRP